METDVYFSAAILGVILALIFIIGWRRIVPVVVAGYIVGTSPAIAQSGGDVDNDVPAINEVRDALLAQKQMLDNYFNGYTAPNKLNDISNSLANVDLDTTAIRNNNAYLQTQIVNNTSDISNDTAAINQNSAGMYNKLNDISNALYSSQGNAAAQYLHGIQDYLYTINNYQSGNFTGPLTDISNRLDADGFIARYLSGYYGGPLTDISNYSEDSLSELQDLANRTYDSDNDVPKLTEIATSSENAYLEMKNIREKMDAVYGDPVDNNFPGITSAQPVYAGVTLETFDEQVASKPSPTIGYDIDNYDTGFEAITDSFNLSGFQNTEIPLLNVSSTPTIGGDLIGSINYNMGQHASFLSGIIRPLLTAWVCYLILSFTTRKTVDLIAA